MPYNAAVNRAGINVRQRVSTRQRLIIQPDALDMIASALRDDGYEVVGPTVRDSAIVYDSIAGVADLPVGWTDVQAPGSYRLAARSDNALFGYAVGPHSWKQFLYPPAQRLWDGRRTPGGFEATPVEPDGRRFAFIGVRGCELAAIKIQDRVLAEGKYPEPHYAARRREAFLVAVQCAVAASTCFCASMGTGPQVDAGFDLSITELIDDEHHVLLVDVGSDRGASIMDRVSHERASSDEAAAAQATVERTAQSMERTLETRGLREALAASPEHPRWQEVADRCLTCGNCTMVCPTCFCHTVEDVSDLTAQEAGQERHWDSCFSERFTFVHGNVVRQSDRSRYRQWLTHKLSSWHDQFGTSGCVGCGRCITWCPVGIDITEEATIIHLGEASHGEA